MRSSLVILLLVLALQVLPLRRALGEDRLDFKYMYYQEDEGRIGVQSPSVILEQDLSPTLTIKLEGIYNAISGATPTGLPPLSKPSGRVVVHETSVTESQEEGDGGDGDHGRTVPGLGVVPRLLPHFSARAGATPAPQPKPKPTPSPSPSPSPSTPSSGSGSSGGGGDSGSSSGGGSSSASAPARAPIVAAPTSEVDTSQVEDERWAVNLDVTKRVGDHSIGGVLSLSTESDYESIGLALRDAIDFNKKNTTLSLGGAFTHDLVDVAYRGSTETKDTVDLMVGLTQVVSPLTLVTANLTLSHAQGFLADPYKVADLNGYLFPESRPDHRDKVILFLSLNQMIPVLDGSAEVSWRLSDDTFGIKATTWQLAWYQKLGEHFVLRPSLRWYEQTEADFYGLHFTGSPSDFSSDYRVSALNTLAYGLKLIWTPRSTWSMDAGYERYEMEGTDGETPAAVYPNANVIVVGSRWWF